MPLVVGPALPCVLAGRRGFAQCAAVPAAALALASDASWKEVSLKTNQEALNLQNGNCSGTSTIIHDFSLHLHHSNAFLPLRTQC